MADASSIQIAALDLDDTLLRSDGSISARTLETLQDWCESGRRLVVATGRPPRGVAQVVPPILSDVPWICYNGAEIHQQGSCIYQDLIQPDVARQVTQYMRRVLPECAIGLEIEGRLHLDRPHARPKQYTLIDLDQLADQAVAKLLLFGDDYERICATLCELPKTTRVILSDKYRFAQVMSSSADKANALGLLAVRWGYSFANIIAFGDDINDVEMIRQSRVGVAMENAIDAAKEVADLLTFNQDEEGVAVVLERVLAGSFTDT